MPVPGKLDIILKINEFPADAITVKNGWKEFVVVSEERSFLLTVRPAVYKKLEDAKANYPQWVATIGGQLGPQKGNTYTVLNPNIQVFEKKPKEPKPDSPTPANDGTPSA